MSSLLTSFSSSSSLLTSFSSSSSLLTSFSSCHHHYSYRYSHHLYHNRRHYYHHRNHHHHYRNHHLLYHRRYHRHLKLYLHIDSFQVLSRACGLVVRGELQDPTVATWLLGPEVKERNFHHLVEHFLPQETDLLQGIVLLIRF